MHLPITGGAVEIDGPDAPLVSGLAWRVTKSGACKYAVAWVGPKLVPMHRLIMDAKPGQEVDHKNGDGLDNRRANLRLATRSQNAKNRRATERCSSPFKGVSVKGRKFVVQIKQNGQCLKIGTFDSEHRAARAYDAAASLFHGPFARTNAMMGLYDKHADRQARPRPKVRHY